MMLLICLLRRFGREIPSYRGVGVAVPMSCFITKVQLSCARMLHASTFGCRLPIIVALTPLVTNIQGFLAPFGNSSFIPVLGVLLLGTGALQTHGD